MTGPALRHLGHVFPDRGAYWDPCQGCGCAPHSAEGVAPCVSPIVDARYLAENLPRMLRDAVRDGLLEASGDVAAAILQRLRAMNPEPDPSPTNPNPTTEDEK